MKLISHTTLSVAGARDFRFTMLPGADSLSLFVGPPGDTVQFHGTADELDAFIAGLYGALSEARAEIAARESAEQPSKPEPVTISEVIGTESYHGGLF